MALALKWARALSCRALRAPPLRFPKAGFEVIPSAQVLEEEAFGPKTRNYCPVNIGDLLCNKYQVVGKLGFGSTSTAWLAQHLEERHFVALKIFTRDKGEVCSNEFRRCELIRKANPSHPGYRHVRTALGTFALNTPPGSIDGCQSGGEHQCLVQLPMWDSWGDLLGRNPTGRLTEVLLRYGLRDVLLGLDYLHRECKLVHTDIKADNIFYSIVEHGLFQDFVQQEMEAPSPRKHVAGSPIYVSRMFGIPDRWGGLMLADFGSAVPGDVPQTHDAQPNVYRSPEVMIQAPWSYPADIWNVGAMIWDLFEGRHLFSGQDPAPDKGYYTTRAHLAEVVGLLGPPPADLLKRGSRSKEFFDEDGLWIADVRVPEGDSLEKAEQFLTGRNKAMFLDFVRGVLAWRPEDRKTAAELLQHPWLTAEEITD